MLVMLMKKVVLTSMMMTMMTMMTMIYSCAQKKGWGSATAGTSARAAFRHQTPHLNPFVSSRYDMQTYSAICSKSVSNELTKLRRCVGFMLFLLT